MTSEFLTHIYRQFQTEGTLLKVLPFGTGHINDTFLVKTQEKACANYILQRINHHIFNDIPALTNNIMQITTHIQKKLRQKQTEDPLRACLTVILSLSQQAFFQDEKKHFWMCYVFIEGSKSHDIVKNTKQAHEGGKLFGQFINMLSDFPKEFLHETLPNFHHIDYRLNQFYQALVENRFQRKSSCLAEIDFVKHHAAEMQYILELGKAGKIPLRVTHNDTKFNNVLLNKDDQGLCVIDLDTVMPGYLHYDFSDAIRTIANTAMEDEKDLTKINFNMNFFAAFCRGFLGELEHQITANEINSLAASLPLLPFLMGLRFLTDYLNGDTYYKIHFPEHNLQRTRAQFQFIRAIYANLPAIERVILT